SSNRALIYKFLSKFAGVPASSCPIGTLANQQFGLQDNFFGLMLVIIPFFEQFEKESCDLLAHLDGVLVYRRYGGADQTRERLVCESHYTNLFWNVLTSNFQLLDYSHCRKILQCKYRIELDTLIQ